MAKTTDTIPIWLGPKFNAAQGKVAIPAGPSAEQPGLLFLESIDGSGVLQTGLYVWADSAGALRYSATLPTDEDSDGTSIGAGGATAALDNLASVAVSESLISDTDNTDDLGSSAKQWKDLYINGTAHLDLAEADAGNIGRTAGAGSNYIAIASGGVLTMAGTATIDGVGSGNLVDKSAAEDITGQWDILGDNLKLGFGAGGAAADSYILFDSANLTFWDSTTGAKTLAELAAGTSLNPVINGDLSLPNGTFNWADAADEIAGTWSFSNTGAGSDIDIASSMDSGECIHIVANSLTTGQVLDIETDSIGAAGALVYLDITEGGHNATGNFIQCFNGSADVFEVGKYGAVIVAGTASTTAAITATAGHLKLTNGYIDSDTANLAGTGHNFATAANATADTDFFTITNSDAAFDQTLFVVDCNSTGGYDAIDVTYEGTANALHITNGNVAGTVLSTDVAANHTGKLFDFDMGTWLGTADEGIIDIRSDAAATAEAGHAIYIKLQGSAADAAAISGKGLYIFDDGDTQAGSYLVHLESTENDAMYVAKGHVKIANAEQLKFGTGNELAIYNDGSLSAMVLTTDPLLIGSAATNYSSFAATSGLLTFAGTARPTDSIWLAPNDFNAVSGPALGLVATSSAVGWLMDGGSSELIVSSFRTPENWASGTDLTVKIYYCANDANTKDVKFDTHSLWLTDGTDNASTGSYVVDTVTDTMAGAAYVLNVATITIAAADVVADEICSFKVERDAADAADTLDAIDLYILGVEIGYIADRV